MAIKTSKDTRLKTQKMTKESVKVSKRAMQLAKETAKSTIKEIREAIKATISAIKGILISTKALVTAIMAGGWLAVTIILVVCLVAMLCSSIFGIFLSSEKTSTNSLTMKEVVAECNQEFADRLQNIQDENPHDDYILEGTMASWKDVLLVYTIKESKGVNDQEVMTMNEEKKNTFKEIFWNMNNISSEVKTEKVIEQGINTNELPKEVEKRVLHIKLISKTAEQMKMEYSFNANQLKQFDELSSDKYLTMWSSAIYGIYGSSGEISTWKQKGREWSDIRIGNTRKTIGDVGCLVTSVSILIKKSGVPTKDIYPFNPGTFVTALNNVYGFDGANLQYGPISKVVPGFVYQDRVMLKGKTKSEKLALIKRYYEEGYYLAAEVAGATEISQHWVAIDNVVGDKIFMLDPGSDATDLWKQYDWNLTTQFVYFKATK